MAVQFLTDDWAAAVADALNSSDAFKSAVANASLNLQFNISEAPSGEISYYLAAGDGQADVAVGQHDAPDVTVGQRL